MIYKVQANYLITLELEIEGEEGVDMTEPSNWGDIISEHETDYCLYDVLSAEESDGN